MLHAVGFKQVEIVSPQRSAWYRAARAISHHVRGKDRLALAFRRDRAVVHARK
jgi:hypothetical protein